MGSNELSGNAASNITAAVPIGLIFVYMWRKYIKTERPKVNLFKGGVWLIGTWLVHAAVLSEFIYLIVLSYFSDDSAPQRSQIELFRSFTTESVISLKGYNISLSAIMTYALLAAELLLLSSVYISITLGASSTITSAPSTMRRSANLFPKLWALLRLLILPYFWITQKALNTEVSIFLVEVLSVIEYVIASVILLTISIRDSDKSSEELKYARSSLLYSLLFFAITKHGINILNLPFDLTPLIIEIVTAIRLGAQMCLYVSLINLLCPLKSKEQQLTDNDQVVEYKKSHCPPNGYEISLVSPYVDFTEHRDIVVVEE